MSDDTVSLVIVLDVLKRHKVEVSFIPGQKDAALLVKDDKIEVKILIDPIGKRMLHYLSHKFHIPIHHFYHPEMAPPLPGESVQ